MTTTTTTTDFYWKRQPEGGYVARHGFWVYNVYRNDRAARGRQWVLKAWPEGNPEAAQERTGLANARVAKLAAEHTGCFICGRRFPFGTLKPQHSKLSLLTPTWVCRDEKPCRAERDRLTAKRDRHDAPRNYADTLAEIVKAKARVRELESAALKLHDRARELGTPEHELRAIEQQHGFGLPAIPYTPAETKVCIACEQPQGQPHLDWCPVVTGKLSTLPTDYKAKE